MKYATGAVALLLVLAIAASFALWPSAEAAAQPAAKQQAVIFLPPMRPVEVQPQTRTAPAELIGAESTAIENHLKAGFRVVSITNEDRERVFRATHAAREVVLVGLHGCPDIKIKHRIHARLP